jgi:hypothetical protein
MSVTIPAAQVEPRMQTITPTRVAQLDTAITTLQAQGAEVTAAAVHRLVRGHRRTVQVYVKAWRQQRDASSVAPCPVAPALAPTPPVARLDQLRAQVAQLNQAWDDMQRAQAHADLRNGILEAARLTRRVRQADAQKMNVTSLMQPDAVQQRAQMCAELTALVGDAEVEAVLADSQYRPWWLEG